MNSIIECNPVICGNVIWFGQECLEILTTSLWRFNSKDYVHVQGNTLVINNSQFDITAVGVFDAASGKRVPCFASMLPYTQVLQSVNPRTLNQRPDQIAELHRTVILILAIKMYGLIASSQSSQAA